MSNQHGWRRRGVAFAGVAAIITAGAGLIVESPAAAASSADVSISQAVTGSTVAGQTTYSITVHNAGPSTASYVNINSFITTTSSGTNIAASGATACEVSGVPEGSAAKGMFSCQIVSMTSGKTDVVKVTLSGTQGDPFTVQAFLGQQGPSDPNQANNTSTISSFFGPAADLRVGQKATVGAAGKATIVSSTRNVGPSTANALQLVTEIKSAGFSGVGSSSNLPASCQFIPPASGYNTAVACSLTSLGTGKLWSVTFSFTGTAGGSLVQKATDTANNPSDPVASNNTSTITTHYGR